MLKYKIITEKLDWKGEIVREIKDFEDPRFDINVGAMLSDFVAKGKLNFSLAKPKFDIGDLFDATIKAKNSHARFNRYEPGATMVVSEYIPSISAQFVAWRCGQVGHWERTDKDLVEKRISK